MTDDWLKNDNVDKIIFACRIINNLTCETINYISVQSPN